MKLKKPTALSLVAALLISMLSLGGALAGNSNGNDLKLDGQEKEVDASFCSLHPKLCIIFSAGNGSGNEPPKP